ncbi:hypothetical protein U9M48_016719 [Paspalum notatum var. saurae]|uniref:Uncharacterized protein n=1 Tax=Paspalum notatum var. saurae TaxID=547442 RepID=A0AAQ3T886_PASNO
MPRSRLPTHGWRLAQQINASLALPLSRRSIAPWRHADATHNTTPSPNPAEAECLSRSEAEHLRLWAVGDRRRRDLDVLHLAADRQCQGVQTAEPTHLRSAVQIGHDMASPWSPVSLSEEEEEIEEVGDGAVAIPTQQQASRQQGGGAEQENLEGASAQPSSDSL